MCTLSTTSIQPTSHSFIQVLVFFYSCYRFPPNDPVQDSVAAKKEWTTASSCIIEMAPACQNRERALCVCASVPGPRFEVLEVTCTLAEVHRSVGGQLVPTVELLGYGACRKVGSRRKVELSSRQKVIVVSFGGSESVGPIETRVCLPKTIWSQSRQSPSHCAIVQSPPHPTFLFAQRNPPQALVSVIVMIDFKISRTALYRRFPSHTS
ncbi:uncharacterized protein BCR38DRAFT_42783 [Pseudomassariella vexata]|uniref:Uncharacterized protein n=1 Tax=Pseudomassariella vexata TaxID=1141098 RepID=A0A1Y2DPK9_9PEZI|nr:uncharacterized protein BCR38DRAFT_42783 [Pseudomassariella vexata]ORY60605.1 hypothetical protein BCR38DRAFT_42783 [Pseudomassariella vexata]